MPRKILFELCFGVLMCVYRFFSCVSWPHWLPWKLSRAGDLLVRIWLFISFAGGSGREITIHVVLSVTALHLQGNSLSSSCRPPICCCPFVLNSEKDGHLWRLLSLVVSPAFDRTRRDEVLTCLLLFSPRLFVLYCHNYQNGCSECRCTQGDTGEGGVAGGELTLLIVNKVTNDDTRNVASHQRGF